MAAIKRGLQRGLDRKGRAILLMLDETIITATPPLYNASGPIGEQVCVPIPGDRAKRILHGAIDIKSGDMARLITEDWVNETHQAFLALIRSHWRGGNPVLFEDGASQHQSPSSLALAEELGIEVRFLPRAPPELNARDHLWRHGKRRAVGDRPTVTVTESALAVCQYVIDLSPQDRLRQSGVLSGHFWLTSSRSRRPSPPALRGGIFEARCAEAGKRGPNDPLSQ